MFLSFQCGGQGRGRDAGTERKEFWQPLIIAIADNFTQTHDRVNVFLTPSFFQDTKFEGGHEK